MGLDEVPSARCQNHAYQSEARAPGVTLALSLCFRVTWPSAEAALVRGWDLCPQPYALTKERPKFDLRARDPPW